MKAVMISIRPEWCAKITDGQKTIEIRKKRPNLTPPFKCYIYCTNGKDELWLLGKEDHQYTKANGKVIGEFVCDKIIPFTVQYENSIATMIDGFELRHSMLTLQEIVSYIGNGQTGYGWHISKLQIYDKPKDIKRFTRYSKKDIRPCQTKESTCHHESYDFSENTTICNIDYDGSHCPFIRLKKPPQSWCYVEELEETA